MAGWRVGGDDILMLDEEGAGGGKEDARVWGECGFDWMKKELRCVGGIEYDEDDTV